VFERAEFLEGADDAFWLGQDGDGVRLLSGAWGLAGFELTLKDECWEGELLFWESERGAKEDLGRPASGESHQAHAFFEVAVAGQKLESFLDKGLWIQRDEAGLVLLDALVVSGIDGPGFSWFERQDS
jgi:hypothetical protein